MRRQKGSLRGNFLYFPRISSISCCSLSAMTVFALNAYLDTTILQWPR
jgi:hypothetical protein